MLPLYSYALCLGILGKRMKQKMPNNLAQLFRGLEIGYERRSN